MTNQIKHLIPLLLAILVLAGAYFYFTRNYTICYKKSAETSQQQNDEQNEESTDQIIEKLPVDEFKKRIAERGETDIILDVRTPKEYEQGHIEGAQLLDYYDDDFEQQIGELNKDLTYFVYCGSGGRSGETVKIMKEKGFKHIIELEGGIYKWKANGCKLVTDETPATDTENK